MQQSSVPVKFNINVYLVSDVAYANLTCVFAYWPCAHACVCVHACQNVHRNALRHGDNITTGPDNVCRFKNCYRCLLNTVSEKPRNGISRVLVKQLFVCNKITLCKIRC